MSKKALITTILVSIVISQSNAQSLSKIIGLVKDSAFNKTLDGACIMLYTIPNKAMVKTAVTDSIGMFEMPQIYPGKYYITSSHTGFKKYFSATFEVKSGEIFNLNITKMVALNKSMDEVTITGSIQKQVITVDANKTVFNVENSITGAGDNAFDLLRKSPGVSIDNNSNISLKGKNGVNVHIDGRPTKMQASELGEYLKSISSSNIAAIEIINNPSAQYDAEGNAGIVNIKFKKNKKEGFSGTFMSGISMYLTPKTNTSITLNGGGKYVKSYFSYDNCWGYEKTNMYLDRTQSDSIFNEYSRMEYGGWSHNFKAGADFAISQNQTIGINTSLDISRLTDTLISTTKIGPQNNTNVLTKELHSNNITAPLNKTNKTINLNYHFQDSLGHVISFDGNGIFFSGLRKSFQTNIYHQLPLDTFLSQNIYFSESPNNIDIYTGKLDYQTPFKKGTLSVGIKYTDVKTDNTYNFFNIINQQSTLDSSQSNVFKYKEFVAAAYVNYVRTINRKWNIEGGLRVENTISSSNLIRKDNIVNPENEVDKQYLDFFPSVTITHNININNNLSFAYNRRIDRPNYQDLNPFEIKLDELTYIKGNPFLMPQYSDNLQLTHTFKSKYITTLSYSHVNNFFAKIIDTTDKIKTFLTQKNIKQDIITLNIYIPIQITKWWSINTNINAYNSVYRGNIDAGRIVFRYNIPSGSINLQQTMNLGNGYSAELLAYYEASSIWAGSIKTNDYGNLDIGIQKAILKNMGSIKIGCADVFHTLGWRGYSNYGGSYIKTYGDWESTLFKLNFTYKFGNRSSSSISHKSTNDETKRIRTTESGGALGNQ